MPVKKKGGKKKAGGKKKSGAKRKGTGKSKGKKSAKNKAEKVPPPVPDPLSYAAMLNAYYIAHGPVHFLSLRGYNWTGGGKKKKKKGGKKRKK